MENSAVKLIMARVSARLLDSFCELMDALPTATLLRAADVQRRLIEGDLAADRTASPSEAQSIVSFCRFLSASARGEKVPCPPLPVEHSAYYRKIIQRLVKTGELPFAVQDEFDANFCEALFKALTAPA